MASRHTVIEYDNALVLVGYCPFCGVEWRHKVDKERYFLWRRGELVQIAFPTMTADERELLVSGICNLCWDKTFGGEG